MNQLFDYFDLYENPSLILCNPSREQLYAMGEAYDTNLILRFNAMSEFSFKVHAQESGSPVAYYDLLVYPRQVYVQNQGYFIITETDQQNDGVEEYTQVKCMSAEYIFLQKKISVFRGTYKFYDLINPSGTLLQTLIDYAPGWTVGTVDASLLVKYRTFDVRDTTIYNFLMETTETAFQCVFTFDTINKTISASVPTVASATTDIFLSYDNLVTSSNLKPINEELVTALNVYGGGNLSINTVNPLGTNTIYNFDYFKTTQWMSASLITAIDNWEAKTSACQVVYADLLTTLKTTNGVLITQEGELTDLQAELVTLEGVQAARIEGGLDYSDLVPQISAKEAEITVKIAEINTTGSAITVINSQLAGINSTLTFANNFTQGQLDDLSNFVIGSTYQNDNFIQTDTMTDVEVQDMAQELYDQAVNVLNKVSQPRYTFSIDAVNFVFLKEFQTFTNQLSLGSTVTVVANDREILYPALLELDLTYDNPDQFKMTFSNRLRLDNSAYIYGDFYNQSQKAATNTNFNSEAWSNWEDEYKNDVSSFITSALDASLNNLISSNNEEIVINQNGLRGKKFLSEGVYSPEQVWLTSNTLAFSDNNFNTAKLALGKIATPTGGSAYGLVGDVIVGRLLAGQQLTITNDKNNFLLDENGATLNNASFTLSTANGNNQIFLDPYSGIKIRSKLSSGSFKDSFYVDGAGNVIFAGTLQAASGDFTGTLSSGSGYIGGWKITSNGLYDYSGNYIRSDGKVKLGMLTIDGNSATFNGNIYANNLRGLITSTQIGSVNASTVNQGTMSADRIYGGTISWPGASMSANTYGSPFINGEESLEARSGGWSALLLTKIGNTGLYGKNVIIGSTADPALSNIYLNGQVIMANPISGSGLSVTGQTIEAYVGNSYPNRYMNFVNGILVNFSTPDVDYGTGGNYIGETINGGSLGSGDITDVLFTNAEMENMDLSGRYFHRVSFHNADLYDVDLSDSNFYNCDFDYAHIKCVINNPLHTIIPLFANCSFYYTDFSDSSLFNVEFSGCLLFQTTIAIMGLSEVFFDGCHMIKCDFTGTTSEGFIIESCTARNCQFGQSTFNNASFSWSDLTGSYFDDCDLSGTVFEGCNLTDCVFTGSTGYTFNNCITTGVIT